MARTMMGAARAARGWKLVCLAVVAGGLQAGLAAAGPAPEGTAFVLPDGGSGSIGGKAPAFWLQLPGGRIDIRNAASLSFRSAQQVGRDTLVVLVQSTDECRGRLLLVAQGESGPLQTWDIGNCRTLPATQVSPDGVAFEVEQDGRITRHVFANGRLQASERAVVPEPAVPPAPQPAPPVAQASGDERGAPAARSHGRERPRTGPVRRPPKPVFDTPAMNKTIRIN